MKDKIELAATLIGVAVAVLTYVGIEAYDLWGLVERLGQFLPFIYLVAGFAVGFGVRALMVRLGAKRCARSRSDHPTKSEVRESFDGAPYETKVLLKAMWAHGAVYRSSDDFNWTCLTDGLKPFVNFANIQNRICRCTLKDSALRQFEEMPELLRDVIDSDIESHAVRGTEGVKPIVYSADKPIWWFYSDDETLPAPCGTNGFMRNWQQP